MAFEMGLTRQFLLSVCLLSLTISVEATNFKQCGAYALGNYTIYKDDISMAGMVYEGPIRGLKGPKPLNFTTFTQYGCKHFCGSAPELNSFFDSASVLTNWILPTVTLFSQLPFEALGFHFHKNFEAFVNWIGSPAATLSTTLFNIHTIHQCRILSQAPQEPEMRAAVRDTLYILSSINQFEYRRRGPMDQQRDTALLRGILFPYVEDAYLDVKARNKLTGLAQNLAFQLRLQHRRGVVPLIISLVWFFLALIFSIVTAFSQSLGENLVAHSVATGLLLSFAPALVIAGAVDGNPVSTARCAELIERWLRCVDEIFSDAFTFQDSDDENPFSIGIYIGAGRRVRYCAVAATVLSRIQDPTEPHMEVPSRYDAIRFKEDLPRRPKTWYLFWLLSFGIATVSFGTAFAESYGTPTVGLGCRSLSYVCWYLPSIISWFLLGLFQEPPTIVRVVSLISNMLSVLALIAILLLQTTNAWNSCFCKSVAFVGGLSKGYMDFETAAFYAQHFDVRRTWAWATGCGFTVSGGTLAWLGWRYARDKSLWKAEERASMGLIDGVDMQWLT